ncbi:hypothetical protein QP610_10210, partial [Lactobacillus gasseri]|nr:hypothetical protein [Lactobacillus gasseri]
HQGIHDCDYDDDGRLKEGELGRDDGDHLHDHENAYDQAAHIDDVVHHNQSLYNRHQKARIHQYLPIGYLDKILLNG